MLESKFERVLVDFVKRRRDYCLVFNDSVDTSVHRVTLLIDSIAPQYAVSTIHIDAAEDDISLSSIAKLLTDRAKRVMSAVEFSESVDDINKIMFAAKILENTMLVIHNAAAAQKGSLSDIQEVLSTINVNKGTRLRVAAIGDMGLLHNALRDHLKFLSLKLYNIMDDAAEMDLVLSKVRDLTVGSRMKTNFGNAKPLKEESAEPFIYYGRPF